MKVVHDAVVLCSLLNNNWPRVQCGIKNALIVLNVIVHLIQCWHVTVQIRKFIAVHVTVNYMDQKDSVMVTDQHCHPTVNLLFYSKCYPNHSLSIIFGN